MISVILSLFFCFFKCPAAPRDLHSFPTRRSSDLATERAPKGGEGSCFAFLRSRAVDHGRPHHCGSAPPWRRPRSEEHTSELQSHVNLVCRLLLEKKKKILILHVRCRRYTHNHV